jgi:hypothetical protein
MIMKRLLLLSTLFAGFGWGQPEPQSRAIIEVKHVDTRDLAKLLSVPFANIQADEKMHVLVVSGPASAVATMQELARKLDVEPAAPPPRPNIELTGYLVFGSLQPKGDEVPAELAPAIKQLHSSFQYKSYRMVDSFIARGRDGQPAQLSGLFPVGLEDAPPATYEFAYNRATISDGNPRVLHVDNMQLRIKVPFVMTYTDKEGKKKQEFSWNDGRLLTNIDVREGQKVVVGKSNININEDALILIVTAKMVE